MADDTLAWAEFGDTLRLPVDLARDYLGKVPWQAAGFLPQHPLVDIGCGSGLSTLELADRYPETEIIAVEPDQATRSLLMLRIAERPEVRSRTTVLPESILDCWLPAQCGGALLFNVIYFLGGQARDEFWQRMARVLVPGAPVLMSRSYGGVPESEVERQLVAEATMGRHTYQRFFEAAPMYDGRMRITTTYVVLRDGQKVREVVEQVTPWGLDEELVLSEVPVGQFAIEELNDDYFAIRRVPDLRR
ncbi:class I SAM-dependent methyltransferase [Calidifontibacter sp. DB0510]|uniref:Class I SAM-dependent methyltransferase n=1 Tax=Metallococcus carri TaxID=1656884 RepID=A0A967AWV5_9MICO|nr:class I SAM-dependent methyltransferase [Metallococcus carri]NHN54188.1 class I SAM-dependent methyltransferase [Metallococcus carri]NOP36972.1 class I SAM-dependent methyltransferase [Calidifontibacter sp. DB2511S]